MAAILSMGLLVSWAVLVSSGDDISFQKNEESVLELDQEFASDYGIVVYITTAGIFAISLFYIVITPSLLYGVRTGRPGLLTPWLVLTAFFMAMLLLNTVDGLVALDWVKLVLSIICLAITVYFFVCVWFYRQQLLRCGVVLEGEMMKKC